MQQHEKERIPKHMKVGIMRQEKETIPKHKEEKMQDLHKGEKYRIPGAEIAAEHG